jgi:hypothetical protein
VGVVAAGAGALAFSEDGLAVAASADAGLTVAAGAAADRADLRAWVDGRAE